MSDVVLFSLLETPSGKYIGKATLNKPKALNALGQDMIDLLLPTLREWEKDDNIVSVFLDSEGDKAFCAGGDIVAMYKAMQAAPGDMPSSLQTFFTDEYTLDYLIHTFSKPIVVWGNGIVMGGGLGLMSGASHRIVTESSRIAMPEITIGLYPDVGGSWFLNKMPAGCGLFLGLTGASINATDALFIDLADFYIPHEQKDAFLSRLIDLKWGSSDSLNHEKVSDLCRHMHSDFKVGLPKGNVKANATNIEAVTQGDNVTQVVESILSMDVTDDKWLAKAQKGLAAGSPITMHLVFEQLARGKNKTLAECFKMELGMSCRCGELGEFQEGVRALLIDKDGEPNWKYKNVQEVETSLVESFFTPRWSDQTHPLHHIH
ncbi:enoyl-CoA hydratase/isomerase family protein [Aestuariibacter sp. AA17]|uniref:3-hydroxyisobutyryl-CoA hydrolase n=1 Tax=Fluctibacter corallii TaxID=2984329 RepID=A0ABT3A977_9ALTE|nr:enoyl-CoA hydratase/isomerase family protein [Aestuariibacter sp. AA17]MCV2885236.1 enoyl-CoA hydratase/isomerase family protein [Aestuariibacter sp. AA17]